MAREAGLDLVEVAPNSKPPVCRIMDYGKHLYAQKKKERKSRAQHHETELKGVRIRTPKIGVHDLEIKVNRARKFLERGDRVQFWLRFRGREMAHQDLGRDVLNSIKASLGDVSKVDQDFKMERRQLTMVLAPLAKTPSGGKPKPKPKPAPAEAQAPAAQATPASEPAAAPVVQPPAGEAAAAPAAAATPPPAEAPTPEPAAAPAPEPAAAPAQKEPPAPPAPPAEDEPKAD